VFLRRLELRRDPKFKRFGCEVFGGSGRINLFARANEARDRASSVL